MEKKKLNKEPSAKPAAVKGALQRNKDYTQAIVVTMEGEILRTEIFDRRNTKATHIVFTDREGNRNTWDVKNKKWRTGTIYQYIDGFYWWNGQTKVYIPKKANETTKEFFGTDTEKNALHIIFKAQEKRQEQKLKERYEKKTQTCIEEMSWISDKLPAKFIEWAKREIPAYILYNYERKNWKGYCTHCGKEVDLKEQPHHNGIGMCPRCHKTAMFKTKGRIHSNFVTVLFQWNDPEYVIRFVNVTYKLDAKKREKPQVIIDEFKREIGRRFMGIEKVYTKDYHNRFLTKRVWGEGIMGHGMYWQTSIYDVDTAVIYPGSADEIQKELDGHIPVKPLLQNVAKEYKEERWRKNELKPAGTFRMRSFLATLGSTRGRAIESMIKVGMYQMAREAIEDGQPYTIEPRTIVQDPNKTSLIEALGLTRLQWKKILNAPEEMRGRRMLQVLRTVDWDVTKEQVIMIDKIGIGTTEELKHFRQYVSINKLLKYASRQTDAGEYLDYLRIRERNGYAMDSIGLFPKDLRAMHDRMVIENEKRERETRKNEVNKKFAQIKKLHNEVEKIYGWTGKAYAFVVPKDAGDILDEGATLHHCVGSGDHYFKKYVEGKSKIIFCRHKDTKDERFVTIEISGEKIQQWYGAHDGKTDEKEEIEKELRRWIKVVKKRIKDNVPVAAAG